MVLRRRREGSTFARPLSVVGLLVLAEMDYRGMEFGPRWGRGFDTGTLGCSDRPMCQCDNSFATLEETHVDTLTPYRFGDAWRCSLCGVRLNALVRCAPSDEGIVVSR